MFIIINIDFLERKIESSIFSWSKPSLLSFEQSSLKMGKSDNELLLTTVLYSWVKISKFYEKSISTLRIFNFFALTDWPYRLPPPECHLQTATSRLPPPECHKSPGGLKGSELQLESTSKSPCLWSKPWSSGIPKSELSRYGFQHDCDSLCFIMPYKKPGSSSVFLEKWEQEAHWIECSSWKKNPYNLEICQLSSIHLHYFQFFLVSYKTREGNNANK
jgi:hypothetical protein